jgi:hypothetical protein
MRTADSKISRADEGLKAEKSGQVSLGHEGFGKSSEEACMHRQNKL